MMLLTKANRAALPGIGAQDGMGMHAIAYVKLFHPASRYTFYVTEFDGDDLLFGYVVSPLGPDCDELGYASLTEIKNVRGPLGLSIERDRHFKAQSINNALRTRA